MTRSRLLVCAMGFLVLAGCGQNPNAKIGAVRTESTLPTGWTEIKTSGIALSFPPDWQALDLTSGQMARGVNLAFGKDPKTAGIMGQAKALAASGQCKLFVFDSTTIGSGFASNCNLIEVPAPAGTKLEDVVKTTVDQVKPLLKPGTRPTSDSVDLPAGHFARLTSEYSTAIPKVPSTVVVQYFAVHEGTLYCLSFSGKPTDADALAKVAEQAMKSLRYTK